VPNKHTTALRQSVIGVVVHNDMIEPNDFTRKFSSDLLIKYELSVIKEGADI